MKKVFPNYTKKGCLDKVEKKLNSAEKTILKKFDEYNAVSSNPARVRKNRVVMLEVRDIIEKPLTQIKKEDVTKFLGVVKNAKKTEWTKNDIKKSLKRFLKWHYKDTDLIEDIHGVSKVKAFNFDRINKSTLVKEEELEKLLRVAESLKWKALLMILYEGGCRPQEVVRLKWKDIEFENEHTNITFFSEKTRMVRTIPLKETTLHLKRWKAEYSFPDLKQEDYVFPSRTREKPIVTGSIGQMLKRFCKKAGIRSMFPYLLRHTRITNLKKQNVDGAIIKKFAGHSPDSDVTDTIYTHLNDDDIKDFFLEKIFKIEEFTEEERKEIKDLKEHIESFEGLINKMVWDQNNKIKSLMNKQKKVS